MAILVEESSFYGLESPFYGLCDSLYEMSSPLRCLVSLLPRLCRPIHLMMTQFYAMFFGGEKLGGAWPLPDFRLESGNVSWLSAGRGEALG